MTDRSDRRDRGNLPTGTALGLGAGRRSWPALALALVLGVVPLVGCSGGGGGGGGDDGGPDPSSGITLPGTLSVPTAPGTSALPGPTTTVTPSDPAPAALGVDDLVLRAPATCSGATYTATLSWTATGAVAATVLVDGAQVAAPVPVGGPFDVVLGCDGSAHAVTLVVADGAGGTVIRTQAVSATPEG